MFRSCKAYLENDAVLWKEVIWSAGERGTSLYLSDYSNKLVPLEGYIPNFLFFLKKKVIFAEWYLIKTSGKTLHHIYVFISYLTENTLSFFLFTSSTSLRSCYYWARTNQFCWKKIWCRLLFNLDLNTKGGTAVTQWLRRCDTNRKVAGSIPAGVIEIFHLHKILPIALWPWGRLSL